MSYISSALIQYEYDGLNRRTVADPTPLSSTPNNRYFYYNENWQELEVRGEVSAGVQGADPLEQFVWHPNYIDALATRFYDADIDGIDVEQHYFVHDANYNVTAAVDDTGAVVERYHYSAYGEISYRNPDFTAIGSGNSTIGNHTTYTDRRRDTESGLYQYRNRYYHPQLGKFLTRDPIGYESGDENLYRYVFNNPTIYNDPSGEGVSSLDSAIERCTTHNTRTAKQIECLESLLIDGFPQNKIRALIKKLKPIAECEAIHALYKAASLKSAGYATDTDCSSLTAKCAALTAEVAGRTAYLSKKCDYILQGSKDRGSVKAEQGHRQQLADKTKAAARCAARLTVVCCGN